MKNIILIPVLTFAFIVTSCKKNEKSTEIKVDENTETMQPMDSSAMMNPENTTTTDNTVANAETQTEKMEVSAQKPNFSNLLSNYQKMSGALANDNDKNAASEANGMLQSLAGINKSGLSKEQLADFNDIASSIKEHAEHIKESVGKIDHQREHFAIMSDDFYALSKDFDMDKTLYKIHCPMYQDKGANWLSNSKEVKNPYFGKQMQSCGEVKEEIK